MNRDEIRKVLKEARTIVVFGCSHQSFRTSNQIARYLQSAGYRIIPVNPHYENILDEESYPHLDAIPEDIEIDIVNVFRRPQFTEEVVDQVARRMEQTGQKPLIWTQIGVSSQDAQRKAAARDIPYISNRCIMIDHSIMD